ncbi:Fic family protein [Luteolibacter yonseiensis]|uniref:Fic family protein n=1 Tax=Luteolibacter yonseiensis TaxID=1144680 RepID=A0A934R7I6_9BACT|nr:Fic family protein [Luteolibacter yonseiensis]MBK1818429.1 Fic family protein [Luteolibacter yonseiensis]
MASPDPPPYTITPAILSLVAEIAGEMGRIGALSGAAQIPKLRRENRIRSIHASLAIENNTLSLDQVTALLSGRRVLGPAREIREVENAFAAYEVMPSWNPSSTKDLLAAHGLMLSGLVPDAGKFRTRSVGIAQGKQIVHLAPPADRVPGLMKDLLYWLKRTDAHPLIAGCVFHYELEFIHPFADGNGRMGRLWQTLILSQWNPLFAFLPVESVIRDRQASYYKVLANCDKAGNSTAFIEFLLGTLKTALNEAAASEPIAAGKSTKLAPSRHQVSILRQCRVETAIGALMAIAERSDRTKFRNQILKPLLDAGWVEMTLPDKPNSRLQKYRTTPAGQAVST